MKKIYSDNEIRDILGTAPIENKVVDMRIAETLAQIRRANGIGDSIREARGDHGSARRKQKTGIRWRKAVYGFATAAAVLLLSFGICVANPSLAAGIPILGSIFAKVHEVFPFGRMPEDETRKLYDEKIESEHSAENPYAEELDGATEAEVNSTDELNDNSSYQAADHGLTVTFTEYYASNQAIYLGVHIKSEEEFPEFVSIGDTGYQLLQAGTNEDYSFREDSIGGRRNIEGKLEDAFTFVGIMRIDYDDIKVDGRRYDKACEEAEEKGEPLPEVTAENRDQWFDEYEIPDDFRLDMTIGSFHGYCTDKNNNRYLNRGEWNYSFALSKSNQDAQTIQIHEVNDQGIGVESLEVSPVELTIHAIEPADYLTFAVVLDKDGRRLVSGSSNAYELAVTGHDISTITVYICDYDEYMDEIKAYALEDDEKFRNVLEERALFKKTVDTQR